VILAAGFSRRLGKPKQTLVVGGETLVERGVRVAVQAGLSPVIVVVNPEAEFAASLQALGAVVVINPEAAEGMASSIRGGVAQARQRHARGLVLMTCDQVAVRPEHLRALYAEPARITGSQYAGRTGVPAYFPSSSFDALLRLQGDAGARNLLRGAFAIAAEELELDVDTGQDVARARALFYD
jgi:CTP:molybdopterin cytidylyltransferase MocA